ncbi:helix-turn-helix domain-containing protein [Actinomycetospora corticicola]|uniref:Type II secretory pathway pseudopilin PulG n=1 Tax=Actinomycetospora corticicola TaxID=663602 RepID=A0A7Y9DSX5_9PSEU|nr:type II secretory pathway pseudopilin PulG [Actinomycetospora corticicola]
MPRASGVLPCTVLVDALRLLAADGPAADLERAAASLAGSDPETAALVLRVRATIEAGRRREAELAALVDTARDLAGESDPGLVLDAIVRRARALLGTDVAYLTLYDAGRGDTFMRATAGSVSAAFQGLRLPVGAGLGGLVAQSRHAHWTTRYPADPRYRHTDEIDAAVSEEGIVAICGTPLLVGEEFVGVLFAANRSARPFTPDDVALLGSLAALAAVSLTQTRAAAETATALAGLRAAHADLARAADAHDRFAALVLGGGDVTDLAAALADLLDGWVRVVDDGGAPIATAGPVPDDLDVAACVHAAAADPGRLVAVAGAEAVTVVAAHQQLATLVVAPPAPGAASQGPRSRIVERAATVSALVLLFRAQASESEQRHRGEALLELLGGDTPSAALRDRVRALGVEIRRPHRVLVARCAEHERARLAVDAAHAVGRSGLVAERPDAVVVLLPDDEAGRLAEDLARPASDGSAPVTVGVSEPVLPAEGLVGAAADARRAAEALVALGREGRAGSVAELGFAALLLSRSPDVGGYVESVLGPLLEHDRRRGTDLVGTLAAWFAAGRSPTRAASTLHVHVNTVTQRLDRVRAVLGEDWQDPERTLELHLALRLRGLAR